MILISARVEMVFQMSWQRATRESVGAVLGRVLPAGFPLKLQIAGARVVYFLPQRSTRALREEVRKFG